jgi:hypothetical protein
MIGLGCAYDDWVWHGLVIPHSPSLEARDSPGPLSWAEHWVVGGTPPLSLTLIHHWHLTQLRLSQLSTATF